MGMNRRQRFGATTVGFALLILAGGLFSGCASTRETSSLQQGVYGVEQNMNDLNRRVQALEQQAGKESARASNLAEVNARLEELRVQLGKLNGRLEEQEHRLEQRQRTSLAAPPSSGEQPETRIPAGAGPGSPDDTRPAPNIEIPKSESPDKVAKVPTAPPPPPEIPKGVPPIQPPPDQNPEKAAYDRAFDLFQKNQFQNARQQFQGFLKQYPQSATADTALYWVGECYYAEKQYQNSIETFQQVLNRYPNGSKAPNAMLKQATAFQQIGDNTAARILYERLIEKFPKSPQAQIAKQKLKQVP
jgi:tol-pal system protein YbgF